MRSAKYLQCSLTLYHHYPIITIMSIISSITTIIITILILTFTAITMNILTQTLNQNHPPTTLTTPTTPTTFTTPTYPDPRRWAPRRCRSTRRTWRRSSGGRRAAHPA